MDPYGQALLDFQAGNKKVKIRVDSDIAETEYWPIAEFFHTEKDMSEIERRALDLCRGRVLDVGAGSGSHSLALTSRNAVSSVTSIDISEGAILTMRQRNVPNPILADFYNFKDEPFDSLLLLMNGAGIAASISNLPRFFNKCKELLANGGQILLDSSDISYLFLDEDGSFLVDLNGAYYGELQYTMTYRKQKGDPFSWLFIDFDTLQSYALAANLACEKIFEDEHYQYLARLTQK